MKPLLFVVAAVMVNAKNEILLAQRPEGKSLAGLWEFPGGKLDEGEVPTMALVRELKEELHIDTDAADVYPMTFVEYEYEKFVLFMPVYLLRRWRGDIVPQEGQKVAWVPLDKLSTYPVPPADEELIGLLPRYLGMFNSA